jgi:hypothetical protein
MHLGREGQSAAFLVPERFVTVTAFHFPPGGLAEGRGRVSPNNARHQRITQPA